jgi:hypothetical protein
LPARAAAPQVESNEQTFLVREIADDLFHRRRQPPYKRRQRDNLIAAGELWVLQQIDHLDPVSPGEMLFAHIFEIAQRGRTARGVACDVQTKNPPLRTTFPTAGTHTAAVPRFVNSNSRASAECGIPRDFRIER